MADYATPKDIEENVRQITDSNWKSALRAAMRVLEEPKYLKVERLAAVRRGIEETVEKFGDQHPRQKDKMINWGNLQIQLIEDFVAEIESGGTPGGEGSAGLAMNGEQPRYPQRATGAAGITGVRVSRSLRASSLPR